MGEDRIDLEHFELRLPLWAVTDSESLGKWGLPDALREFQHDIHGRFLDLFTEEEVAEGYIRKAGFTKWRAVALATPAHLRAIVIALEQRGCNWVGIDCTERLEKSGRFFSTQQFLALVERTA
jgi:hypothetical protein